MTSQLAVSLLVLTTMITGCAVSAQKFVDRSYNEGIIEREVKGRSVTIAPPFGSSAVSKHTLDMDETLEGWRIIMGTRADLEGGELSPELLNAIKLMMAP